MPDLNEERRGNNGSGAGDGYNFGSVNGEGGGHIIYLPDGFGDGFGDGRGFGHGDGYSSAFEWEGALCQS